MKGVFLLAFVGGVVYNTFMPISLWALVISMLGALGWCLKEYKL